MEKDIRFLLVFLIVALAVLVWLQNQNCTAIPNSGSLKNTQHFSTDNSNNNQKQSSQQNYDMNPNFENRMTGLTKKEETADKTRSSRESQKVTSRIIDNILRNEKNAEQELDSLIGIDENSEMSNSLLNPLNEDINSERNSLLDSDQGILDELIRDVNTGNDLTIDNPKSDLYRSKSRSINAAKKYRKVSYKDSQYRNDFEDDGSPSQISQDELNGMYDNSLVFRNNEYNTNGNFKGFNETSDTYGNADLNDFKPNGAQTQQEKIMSLYNSNEYLPNNNLLDNKLTKGFQILDNPVSVSNPNLIPVLKSIPVSSVLGSNRNSTYDIRAEPPCPKTVVSPFLNSSIMPDIYSTQRGCL